MLLLAEQHGRGTDICSCSVLAPRLLFLVYFFDSVIDDFLHFFVLATPRSLSMVSVLSLVQCHAIIYCTSPHPPVQNSVV